MVIIKDLSRLGREHIETDDYLEKWFPEHDVRCIAILDNIDTFSESSNNEIAPILNWANERHNKETSKKIKKTFKDNIKLGLYMGSEPPYGLIKSKENKHKLIVDEDIRPIIVDIFNKAKEEWSLNKIAEYLTKKNIPIPSLHKNSNRGIKTKAFTIWDPHTIKDILSNEMYIGNMVQGKTTKLSLKSKKVTYIPKDDWIVVPNTHEAIIDKETFNLVQTILKQKVHKKSHNKNYLLKGLLICKECGHTLSIQQNKNARIIYTVCNYYKKYSKCHFCTAHRFNYQELENMIICTLRKEIQKYVDTAYLTNSLKEHDQKKEKEANYEEEVQKSQMLITKYHSQLKIVYLDKINEKISEEMYLEITKEIQEKINKEKDKINKLTKIMKENKNKTLPDYQNIVRKFLSLNNPKRDIILWLVNKIEVNEDGNTDLYLKVKPPF